MPFPAINRRHKVGLFLVLAAAGASLLLEATAVQTVGVVLLGVAAAWGFGASVRLAGQRSHRKFWLGRFAMKSFAINLLVIAGFIAGASASGQSTPDTLQAHVATATAAAGQEWVGLFNALCAAPRGSFPRQTQEPPPPDRSRWHAEPVKV